MCGYNYLLPLTKSAFSPDLYQIRTTYNSDNHLEQKAWKKFYSSTRWEILPFPIIIKNRENCRMLSIYLLSKEVWLLFSSNISNFGINMYSSLV